MQNYKELVKQMTLEEKASMCSNGTTFGTKAIERLGIPSIILTDGPNGIRLNLAMTGEGGEEEVLNSQPATCFPAAAAVSSSWNVDVAREVGAAIGEEGRSMGVSLLWAPGVNIKRSPLCGRNFEYYSEDPYQGGDMAAAFVQGLQISGVGAVVKHFACNNSETERLIINSDVDERTLREIYLAIFERIVKQAQPWAIMCSYNKVNGVHATENETLIKDILRGEWGFNGLVMSDAGAVDDRVISAKAGLDLEIPGPSTYNNQQILQAVKSGILAEAALDKMIERILRVVFKATAVPARNYDKDQHHAIAKKAAAESIVLLKNENGLLPLDPRKISRLAVIGRTAKYPRFQGFGSSYVKATKLDNAHDELIKELGQEKVLYADGYDEVDFTNKKMIQEAVQCATAAEAAVLFVGMPERGDMEGFDRTNLDIPDGHVRLIREIAAVQPNTIIMLHNGSVIEMGSWIDKVPAVIECWLSGQAGAAAEVDTLLGKNNPSGKLCETFPRELAHNPSYLYFPCEDHKARYGEGIYVGYRYYDKKKITPLFPFGFGLSYTAFDYSNLVLSKKEIKDDETLVVSVDVTNAGKVAGQEVVQLYVHDVESSFFRPIKELKGFKKLTLKPGETRTVSMELGYRDFAFYHPSYKAWIAEEGEFEILIGSSSADIRLKEKLAMISRKYYRKDLSKDSLLADWMNDEDGRRIISGMLESGRIHFMIPMDNPMFSFFCNNVPLKKAVLGLSVNEESMKTLNDIIELWEAAQTSRMAGRA
jgi:beta-glucosidase